MVLEAGLVMTVDHSPGDDIRIQIQANSLYVNDHIGELVLVVQSGGQIPGSGYRVNCRSG